MPRTRPKRDSQNFAIQLKGCSPEDEEFEAESKEWAQLAAQACKFLGIEPDPAKRRYWGVSHFHGFREVCNKGVWTRQGGEWTVPKYGSAHLFLDELSAWAWADETYKLLAKWSADHDLECPYKVVEVTQKGSV